MVEKKHMLYRAARTKPALFCLSIAVSLIAITTIMKTRRIDNDMFDSLANFQDYIFSEQYSETASASPETPDEEALLDVVGEKLTAHSLAK